MPNAKTPITKCASRITTGSSSSSSVFKLGAVVVVGNADTVGCGETVGVVVGNADVGVVVGNADTVGCGETVGVVVGNADTVGCREEKVGVVVGNASHPGSAVGTFDDNDEGAVVLFKVSAVVVGVVVGNVPPPGDSDEGAVVLLESSCKRRDKAEAADSSTRTTLPPCSCAGRPSKRDVSRRLLLLLGTTEAVACASVKCHVVVAVVVEAGPRSNAKRKAIFMVM